MVLLLIGAAPFTTGARSGVDNLVVLRAVDLPLATWKTTWLLATVLTVVGVVLSPLLAGVAPRQAQACSVYSHALHARTLFFASGRRIRPSLISLLYSFSPEQQSL